VHPVPVLQLEPPRAVPGEHMPQGARSAAKVALSIP
jgi:hypothetical protein